MAGTALVFAAILTQRIRLRAGWGELGVWLGVGAVYLMMFVRIEIPEERTHLIEYAVLAALINQALQERSRNGRHVSALSFVSFGATALLGFIDESIQALIPTRVFDWRDVGFNGLAALVAVLTAMALNKVGRMRRRSGS